MRVYICSKCATFIESSSSPNSGGCPKGSSHIWYLVTNNGGVTPKSGLSPYQCSKCAITIYSKSSPYSNGCPSGSSHSWRKLA